MRYQRDTVLSAPIARVLRRALDETGEPLTVFAARSGVPERRLRGILSGEQSTVSVSVADRIVTEINPALWHTELAGVLPPPVPEDEVVRLYLGGKSIDAIAQELYELLGYRTPSTAGRAVRRILIANGVPRRGHTGRRDTEAYEEAA